MMTTQVNMAQTKKSRAYQVASAAIAALYQAAKPGQSLALTDGPECSTVFWSAAGLGHRMLAIMRRWTENT